MRDREKEKRARYGDGCVYRRGRLWWVSWREVRKKLDGTAEYVKHFKSSGSEDVKIAQRMLRSELQSLGGRRPMNVDPKKVSYEEIRDNFLATRAERKLRSLKYTDGKPHLQTLNRLDRFFGGWRAGDITIADLRRFRAEYRAEGVTDATVNRHMAALRAMMRQAVKDELLTAAEMPGHFPWVREPKEARDAVYIERAWYDALRKELKEPLRSAFVLAYSTGVRIGELKRLRWRDFDFRDRTVFLSEEVTKTGKSRTVFVPGDFDRKPGNPEDPAFPIGDYRLAWYRACAKIGAGRLECKACGSTCDVQVCPTHGFRSARKLRYVGPQIRFTRHTAVRNMDEAGMEQTRIMAISGHVTDAMFRRYNIARRDDVAEARRAVDRFRRGGPRKL